MRTSGQVLIFDADDTLWENGVLFERVINDYLDWLAHPTLDRGQLRAILDEIEAANVHVHGVGSAVFLRSLEECFRRLSRRPTTAGESAQIIELATALIEHRIELLPGVADALAELGTRHRLLMLTKGAPDEQSRKIAASGLAPLFASTHIVPTKTVETYERLLVEQKLDPTVSWMIGNSPASDILPARAVGMRAVYIPHQDTWWLERAELDPADTGVLTLPAFSELTRHF